MILNFILLKNYTPDGQINEKKAFLSKGFY